MSALEFSNVVDDYLGPLTLQLDAGLTLIVSPTEAPLARLVELTTGVRRPRRGQLRSDGQLICSTPAARRQLGGLLAEEAQLPGDTVRAALGAALTLRQSGRSPEALLHEAGLSALADRAPLTLDERERRAIALTLALSLEAPRLVALHDPLSIAPLVPHRFVLQACHELSSRACVLITTCRWEDSFLLGGRVLLLQRGQLVDAPRAMPGQPCELSVQASDATRLAALLALEPLVASVELDRALEPRRLSVRGNDLEALASTVNRCAAAEGITLRALTPRLWQREAPSLAAEPVRASLGRAIFGRHKGFAP